MNRSRATILAGGLLLLVFVVWIARNTAWEDVTVPMPPRGDAARNPFYGAQRFAESLGANTVWDRTLQAPPADAVLVLSGWRWNLSTRRRETLERWVESGGRLVTDRSVLNDAAFEAWAGITGGVYKPDEKADEAHPADVDTDRRDGTEDAPSNDNPASTDGADDLAGTFKQRCDAVREHSAAADASRPSITYQVCDVFGWSFLVATQTPQWWLEDDADATQAARVGVGQGSVTVVNASPFRYRGLLDGDHGRIFVAAAQLRRGDEVHFLSEENHPSLLALMWQHGAPIVLLTLSTIGLALWRGAARFGPLAPPISTARRSLAEQILGTGHFALRRGEGVALHASVVRGLEEAAHRRVPGYARLSAAERSAAVGRLTQLDGVALDAALHDPQLRRPERLTSTLAFLEVARRRILMTHTRTAHGTD